MEAIHQVFHPALCQFASGFLEPVSPSPERSDVLILFECCLLCNTEASDQPVRLQSGISSLSELWLWEVEKFFFFFNWNQGPE